MGRLEDQTRRIVKRVRIQDAILLSLYAGAAVALVVAAPNAARLLKHVDPDMTKKRHPSRRMSQALSRLVARGLVMREGSGTSGRPRLTNKGKRYAELMDKTGRLRREKPTRWDGRWRIVIFDIWERRRAARDRLRTRLQTIGFVKIQNSVWAYPYDCEELIAFVRTELKLGKRILYLIAEGIEYDRELRDRFGLPTP